MKHIILLFSCLLLYAVKMNAQVTDKINFQMIVRDASDELLSDGTIGIKFQVLQGPTMGSVIFEETHSTTTNKLGLASVKIGGGIVTIGTLNTIDWSNGPYFISINIDPTGGSNYTLQNTSKLNSVALAANSLKSAITQTADYNSLSNKPITITSNQINLLGFLTLANTIDLNATKTTVDLNTLKSFPGFGETTGTAFEVLWSKSGNNVFFPNGNIGVGTNSNLGASAALLTVEGGVLYEANTTFETEIGALKYLDIGGPYLSDFYFGANTGQLTFLKSDPDQDLVFLNDANIIGKLGIGESMVPSYNFNNNNFVIASATPSIRFHDTSSTSSFPSADWSIKINDNTALGESYFSISNFNTGDSNFKIMAGAPSNAFNMLGNGNIGLNITPTTDFEVENTIVAVGFLGGISGLTNLPVGNGTASVENIGSTTIIADNNSDSIGTIIFQNQNQNQMTIHSNGNVAVGNMVPTVTLEVDGNVKMNAINAQGVFVKGHIIKPITLETPTDFVNIDITGKSIIVMNPTSDTVSFGLSNGIEGQVVTLINSGTSTITFYPGTLLSQGNTLIVLEQNESFTCVKNGNFYLVVNLVN